MSGGKPVLVEAEQSGLLWGMEMDTAAAAQELRGLGKDDNADRINGFLSGVGLGAFADQLKDLQLGEPCSTAAEEARGAAWCMCRMGLGLRRLGAGGAVHGW